jgi:GNAT superfamily N-acetyltransferase
MSPNGFELYLPGVADWELLRQIRLRALREDPDAFGSTYEHEAAFEPERWQEWLSGESGPAVLALDDSGAPVGIGGGWLGEPGRMLITAMWSDPARRGSGIGGAILDHLLAWGADHNFAMDLWVCDGNDGARALYERKGFVMTDESQPMRPDSPLTMTKMVFVGQPSSV